MDWVYHEEMTAQGKLHEEKVQIQTADGPMDGFLVRPEAPAGGKYRAVIIAQEAFGVDHHIQEVCRRVAREGYIAIAPEFYHRSGAGLQFGYDDFAKVRPVFSKLTNEKIAEDVGATIGFLEQRLKTRSDEIAIMGFCMGGLVAMIAAVTHPIGTAISYYGGGMVEKREGLALSPVIQDFPKIQCPVLLFFGEQDQSIPPAQVEAVKQALKAARQSFELIVYPGAGHGFSNDERASYEPNATQAAWSKTLAWLKS